MLLRASYPAAPSVRMIANRAAEMTRVIPMLVGYIA
jgi:hypothetical protein